MSRKNLLITLFFPFTQLTAHFKCYNSCCRFPRDPHSVSSRICSVNCPLQMFHFVLQVPPATLNLSHPGYVQLTAHFKCSTSFCRFHPRPSICVIQDHIPVPAAAVPVPVYVLLSHHRVPAADNQHSNQQSQGPDGQSLYTYYERNCQQHVLCQCEFKYYRLSYK